MTTTTNTTLSYEEIETLLETVVAKVQEAICDGAAITVKLNGQAFMVEFNTLSSIELDGAFRLDFDNGEPLEIDPSKLLSVDGLEESDLGGYFPTIEFEGLTVEFECED